MQTSRRHSTDYFLTHLKTSSFTCEDKDLDCIQKPFCTKSGGSKKEPTTFLLRNKVRFDYLTYKNVCSYDMRKKRARRKRYSPRLHFCWQCGGRNILTVKCCWLSSEHGIENGNRRNTPILRVLKPYQH